MNDKQLMHQNHVLIRMNQIETLTNRYTKLNQITKILYSKIDSIFIKNKDA
jgi:hypothetical protein